MAEKFFRSLEHTLDRKFKPPPRFGGKAGEAVPEVDPEDMKAVWQEHRYMQKDHPGQPIAISTRVLQHYCNPGADMQAVCYRQAQLGLSQAHS